MEHLVSNSTGALPSQSEVNQEEEKSISCMMENRSPMNTDLLKPTDTEMPQTTRKIGRRSPSPRGMTWGLAAFVLLSVLMGSITSVISFVRVIQTVRGETPKTPNWSIELGLGLIAFGMVAVVGGIAMWRRCQWGWWLMVGVVVVLLLVMTEGAAIPMVFYLIWLWGLRPLFGFAGACHPLEGDIDEIAKSLGIDWNATPFGRIDQLVTAKQNVEATRLYREHFRCDWDDAHAGVARWHTDIVTHKLRYLSLVVKSLTAKLPRDEGSPSQG